MGAISLNAPVPLGLEHSTQGFDCGVESLNEWLRSRAWKNQLTGASRTYVTTEESTVAGYYCLSSGALAATDAPGSIRRNMPDPIPIAIIGRLAVDKAWHGKAIGAALLQDAIERSAEAAKILGILGVLVHALSDQAKVFYERHGFIASPHQPLTLVFFLKWI
jgi:GNAT superfamily N-acetyltransferase